MKKGNGFFDCMIACSGGKVYHGPQDLDKESKERAQRQSAYERTKAQVYATGNRWAIENFHATHD